MPAGRARAKVPCDQVQNKLDLQLQQPFRRLSLGALLALVIIIPGFVVVGALIPTWGSTPDEITRPLPADDMVPTPTQTSPALIRMGPLVVSAAHWFTVSSPVA